jgi:hypothetical protein
MIDYHVDPHRGVSAVRLGASRTECRAAMPHPPVTFAKAAGATLTDAFHGNAFQVFYDDDDRAEYIELSRSEVYRALINDLDAHRTPADDLTALLSRAAPFDPDNPELGYSYVFPALDLALWRPTLQAGPSGAGDTFATIGIGQPGYFELERTRGHGPSANS